MVRNRYDAQLNILAREMLSIGNKCENALEFIVEALNGESYSITEEIVILSKAIGNKEREIETLCIQLLLRQQPVASDLRKVSAGLKIITDLKRIGELAGNIANILEVQKFKNKNDIILLNAMARATKQILTDSLEALSKKDASLAKGLEKHDDTVDNLFFETKKSLIASIRKGVDDGEEALNCLMVAKYFEKISDHAVNIADWVYFSLTGGHEE